MTKSNVQQYREFQDYTNYIDTSDVMLEFYQGQSGKGLEKYYLMIEEWLQLDVPAENNIPLVIQADGGIGKKSLLIKWYEYHQSKAKDKSLIILHFATTGGNNSNYFYAIYRILIKLRQELNIAQKVQLHEEKLRKYFAYWLDVCNQRIENQILKNLDIFYDKVILVFEGIDYFLDRHSGKEGNIQFWLPKYFPKNIKVIVTADSSSESMKYFNKLNCHKVTIPKDANIMKSMIQSHFERPICIDGPLRSQLMSILESSLKNRQVTSLFVKSYLNCLLPEKLNQIDLTKGSFEKLQNCLQKIDRNRLKQIIKIEQFFEYILDFWGKNLFSDQYQFRELINILISTQKGLTLAEIISITHIELEELKLFIMIFRSFLMNFKDLWMIKNDSFKKSIFQKYDIIPIQINEKIADTLRKTPNSVRKLQEETFQLYCAGNYFKLKEVISDIENFLLLFNPYTKYDLCRYWQKLEERSFDPVIEYNKAIEGFEMHYHPNEDDLFRIITQISRFLREFSDFETYYTPAFRHPKLIGGKKELEEIGILGEFQTLNLCITEQANESKIESKYTQNSEESNEKEQQKRLKNKLKVMYDKIEQKKHLKKNDQSQTEEIKKPKKMVKQSRIQQLNVDIKCNELKFREYYYNEIKRFLEKVELETNEEQISNMDRIKDEDYQEDEKESEQNTLVAKISSEKEKSKLQFKDIKKYYTKMLIEEFELNQQPTTNYYYKRWIWMQFPWVCMSMKCDYSEKLRKCFTSPTSYMSVAEEREFTLQALKIALEAKKKKANILEKVEQIPKLRKTKTSLPNLNGSLYDKLSTSKQNGTKDEASILNLTKMSKKEDNSFVTHSFLSLHNLSKELNQISYKDVNKNNIFITNEGSEEPSVLQSLHKKKIKQQSRLSQSESKQGLLPRIKQNANKEIYKQLAFLEKNNDNIRKQMDSYLYKNQILAKRLKQLKIIQLNNQNQLKNGRKVEEKKQMINELEEKIERVKNQYAYSSLQYERLSSLIKICQKNKTANEQAIPQLINECNNFKKMIKIESDTIQQLKYKIEELKKLTKKFITNCYEKIENEENLEKQIQATIKNQEYFQKEIEKYDVVIAEEVEEKKKELQSIYKTGIKHQSIHQKAKKNYSIDEEKILETYKDICQFIDISREDYATEPKFKLFLDKLAKKKEFEATLQERKSRLQELQKSYEEHKKDLDILNRAKENKGQKVEQKEKEEIEIGDNECTESLEELEKQLHQKQRLLSKTTSFRLNCLGMFNTFYNRLGLSEQQALIITPQFLEKIEQAKILSKAEVCQ